MPVPLSENSTTTDMDAKPPGATDDWWSAFLKEYSRALLHIARVQSSSHDDMMDRYEYILEQLQTKNHHRLQSYVTDSKAQLVTWLFVVDKRLCVDYHRKRYGRERKEPESPVKVAERQARRCLVDLLVDELITDTIPDSSTLDPETQLCRRETHEALETRSLFPFCIQKPSIVPSH